LSGGERCDRDGADNGGRRKKIGGRWHVGTAEYYSNGVILPSNPYSQFLQPNMWWVDCVPKSEMQANNEWVGFVPKMRVGSNPTHSPPQPNKQLIKDPPPSHPPRRLLGNSGGAPCASSCCSCRRPFWPLFILVSSLLASGKGSEGPSSSISFVDLLFC
jgi:hypothetical protein